MTYNIIREKPENGRQYSVAVFVGLDNYLKITPFGVAILAYETVEIISRLLRKFFEFMGDVPKNIITDQQLSIRLALEKLGKEEYWAGNHYYDSFHILRNISPKLKEKEQLRVFTNLINAPNQ